MNKDKAIQLLERLQDPEPYEPMLTKDAYDAIQMAIEALSADGDTISRKAAIGVLHEALDRVDQIADVPFGVYQNYRDTMNELPPVQPEQLEPDQNGDIWITVPDIDKATRIYVQESKSKFCRIFCEEQEQPEPYVGHWIRDRSWSEGVGMGESYGHYWKCDKCGHLERGDWGECGCNFCSNCGSDNREVTT